MVISFSVEIKCTIKFLSSISLSYTRFQHIYIQVIWKIHGKTKTVCSLCYCVMKLKMNSQKHSFFGLVKLELKHTIESCQQIFCLQSNLIYVLPHTDKVYLIFTRSYFCSRIEHFMYEAIHCVVTQCIHSDVLLTFLRNLFVNSVKMAFFLNLS